MSTAKTSVWLGGYWFESKTLTELFVLWVTENKKGHYCVFFWKCFVTTEQTSFRRRNTRNICHAIIAFTVGDLVDCRKLRVPWWTFDCETRWVSENKKVIFPLSALGHRMDLISLQKTGSRSIVLKTVCPAGRKFQLGFFHFKFWTRDRFLTTTWTSFNPNHPISRVQIYCFKNENQNGWSRVPVIWTRIFWSQVPDPRDWIWEHAVKLEKIELKIRQSFGSGCLDLDFFISSSGPERLDLRVTKVTRSCSTFVLPQHDFMTVKTSVQLDEYWSGSKTSTEFFVVWVEERKNARGCFCWNTLVILYGLHFVTEKPPLGRMTNHAISLDVRMISDLMSTVKTSVQLSGSKTPTEFFGE